MGEKLENPYTVENMQQANENLAFNGKSNGSANIRTTHLYLKFKPQNEEELDLIKNDTTLEWYDYPLDYEIVSSGLFYHDPEVPDDKPTYQYVAVEIDKDLPNIAYEVLAELYLPEEDKELTNDKNLANTFSYALEKEALQITNNYLEPMQGANNAKTSSSSWNPAGRVRVWDDVIGTHTTITRTFDHWEYYPCDDGENPQIKSLKLAAAPGQCKRAIYRYDTSVPLPGSNIALQGVKVRARSWFKTKTTLTDTNGNFYISSFNNSVNYSIKWERNDYDIRDGLFVQAYFTGPKKKGNWNVDLVSGKALRHATIHRAAHRYFYQNIGGLLSPTLNGRLKISYLDEAGTSINWGNIIVLLPNIRIYGKHPTTQRSFNTNEIFSTTIHEITHTTHIDLVGLVDFGLSGELIRESWANAVEWHISKLEYNERGEPNYDDPISDVNFDILGAPSDHMQWWNNTRSSEYTPIFIDLVDNFDQPDVGPDDRVTGYTMQMLELRHLKDAASIMSRLNALKNSLKQNKPFGVTDQEIDDLMRYFYNL